MTIHDVSLPIGPDLPIWPGNPPVEVRAASGSPTATPRTCPSFASAPTRTGTHVDHRAALLEGEDGIDAVALDALVGPCEVVDARGLPRWGRGARAADPRRRRAGPAAHRQLGAAATDARSVPRLLHGALAPRARRSSCERACGSSGPTSCPSRPAARPGIPYTALLGAGVVIVEGLDLSAIEPGRYTLAVLPLRLVGGDGARPARS